MSLDRSLKSKEALSRHRNVLTRAERIAMLEDDGRWDESRSVFGLPKVAHRKSVAGQKARKAEAAAAAAEQPPGAAEAPQPAEAGSGQQK
ncbi:MAG: small basic protein [Phycisphaerae bacterium]